MKRLIAALLPTLVLVLVACAPTPAATAPTTTQVTPVSARESAPPAPNPIAAGDLTRTDQQGAVIVEVTPLNLSDPSDQLEFDMALNTHSVDLSMDLAALATLTTDAGVTEHATSWDGPRGGHHVAGKLMFPAIKDGKSILDGAGKLTLTIVNVDAASRLFVWELK
jgi:hypothetical protein